METQRAQSVFALDDHHILQEAMDQTRRALTNQLQIEKLVTQRNVDIARQMLAEAAIAQARGTVINQMLNERPST